MRAAAKLLIVLALAAGCARGDGDGDAIPASAGQKLVLAREDLPRVWVQFDEGPQQISDRWAGERGDPGRFGRQGGWKARFRRPGTATTRGPLVVESRADVFESNDGAEDDLEAIERSFGTVEGLPEERVEVPKIGDAALGATLTQEAAAAPVRFYFIAWRYRNVTASLYVNGFEGRLRLADAIALARKQQRRIAVAG